MIQSPSDLTLILQQSLATPIGTLWSTPEPARARAALYRARQLSCDPDLAQLQIRLLPGNLLAITHN